MNTRPTTFYGPLMYHMMSPTEGLAIGPVEGSYKLFRVWKRENGDLVHYSLAVFPSPYHAQLMVEFLSDKFDKDTEKLKSLN